MLLLGHRGCRGREVENTLAAFDYALDAGCDGFEFDVRRTLDGVPVVWHDARLRGHFLSRQSWKSLRALAARNGGLRRRAVALCTLEEVLERYHQVAWMDIELKVRGMEEQVARLLQRYRPARGFVVSSFRRPILLELHRLDPALPLAYIFERMPRAEVWHALPALCMKPSARLVNARRVAEFHGDGRAVLAWTVKGARTLRRLAAAGVDGVIADDPEALTAQAARLTGR